MNVRIADGSIKMTMTESELKYFKKKKDRFMIISNRFQKEVYRELMRYDMSIEAFEYIEKILELQE